MFKSSEPASFATAFPLMQTVPAAGNPLQLSYPTLAQITLTISDALGNTAFTNTLDNLPIGGVSLLASGAISVAASVLAAQVAAHGAGAAGLWTHVYTPPLGTEFTTIGGTYQWGGTIDLLCQGAADAALARKALLNQWVPNSSTVPTALTLNDDGGGPLFTRTIANASATPVSPDQVLRLGKAV